MGLNLLRVCLDSCIVIYLVEEHPTFAKIIEDQLAAQANVENVVIQVSELAEMECLVMPLRTRNQPLLDKYVKWFANTEILPIDRHVLRRAAQLRADYPGLKTPDAIHLATALSHGCHEFWTNDTRLAAIAPSLVKTVVAM